VRRRIRSASALLASVALAAAVAVAALGQAPILTFSLDEDHVTISQGGTAFAVLRIENGSVYQGDEIEATLESEGLTVRSEPEEIEALAPFEGAAIVIHLTASDDLPLGTVSYVVEVLYSYCIGLECFQFVEEIPITVAVEPAPEIPIEVPVEIPVDVRTGSSLPFWMRLGGLGIGFLFLAVAIVLRRVSSTSWPLYLVVVLFVGGGLAYGVMLDQHEQAQGIGAVLCTSCVGIEVAQHGEPELTEGGIRAIEAIERNVELIVFFAEWCHACPFAEAMVEKVAEHNPRITFRFVDVEAEQEFAAESGVVRSGRTIVPAIMRVGSGEIVFGAEDLEARLLELLEEVP